MTDLQSSAVSGGAGVQLTANASTAHTKGNYATLISSSSAASTGLLIQIQGGTSANAVFLIDIGVGSGTPTVIIPNLLFGSSGTPVSRGITGYFFPLIVASGSQISARCQADSLSATCKVNMKVSFDQWDGPSGTSVEACGPDTATSAGQIVDPATNAETSWVQLKSSTASAFNGFVFAVSTLSGVSGTAYAGIPFDIGTGGSGSETEIVSDYLISANTGWYSMSVSPFLSIPISSGTRIATRCRTGSAGYVPNIGAALYGLVT